MDPPHHRNCTLGMTRLGHIRFHSAGAHSGLCYKQVWGADVGHLTEFGYS